MLQYYLRSALSGGNVRYTRAYSYMEFITNELSRLRQRHFNGSGLSTPGINLMEHILSLVNYDQLASFRNDYERYTLYLINLRSEFTEVIGPNSYSKIWTGAFIYGNRTKEVIVPVQCDDYFKYYPFGKTWDSWKSVQPLFLITHNSPEYTINVMQDVIKFDKRPPDYAFFGIDPIVLILQRYHYLEWCGQTKTNPLSTTDYLHKYVTINLMADCQDIWIRNRTLDMIQSTSTDYLTDDTFVYNPTFNYIGKQYERFSDAVNYISNLLASGNITPEDAFASLPMPTGYYNEWIQRRMHMLYVPEERQFQWILLARDMQDMFLLTGVFLLNKTNPQSITFYRNMYRTLTSVGRNHTWDQCKDSPLATQLGVSFMRLLSNIETVLEE